MSEAGIVAQAQREGVLLVRFLYSDLSGITRAKTVHISQLARKLREGTGLTRAMMAMNLLDQLQHVEGMEPVGEIRLLPDLGTFSTLPWTPSSASVICDMLERDRRPWAACPRSFLKRVVGRTADAGFRVEAGFEHEFYLAREQDGRYVPLDDSLCYTSIGLDLPRDVMHDIVTALGEQGIVVEQAINEYGPGQQEISVRHAPAVTAADHAIKMRDTVRGVALQRGLLASFAPRPFADAIGSGCHLHLSLWDTRDGTNAFYDPGAPGELSATGRSFIAGVLEHLPSLLALTCPSANSYRRLQPSAWSSAYVAWGFDNREAAVRVASPFWGREEETFNLEVKAADASANPYLALGALLVCGLDGIERGLDPGPACEHDPNRLAEEERERAGIRRFPTTMTETLDNLERDRVLMDALGELLAGAYLTVRQSETREFAAHDAEYEIRSHFYRF